MINNFKFKSLLYKIYGFIHSAKYPKELYLSFKYMFNENQLTNKEHIKLASDWLLDIQNSDGGYARKFSFISGLDKSYIETSGYIIPTLFKVSEYLNNDKYKKSAKKAGEWLLSVQNNDGSFSEIDTNTPYAFDTGQVLIGLNFLYENLDDKRYLDVAKKASYWLAENQEDDGSWKKVAYHEEKHTYYSRVSAALLKFAYISDDQYIKKHAYKNIKWILENQMENGFFKYSSFLSTTPAYLHTIVYIMEGLLDIYDLTDDKEVLKSVFKFADRFKEININRDIILCSQYDENYNCINSQKCITGLAQWAGVCLRLYEKSGDKEYLDIASATLFYLKTKHIQEGNYIKGTFPASVPFWGRYGAFDFVNWGNKFFIDSLLIYDKYNISKTKEQENFVSLAFLKTSVVTDSLSFMDKEYIKILKRKIKNKKIRVLDIGCGKGVIINELKKYYPEIEFIGVDPVFESKIVKKGSIYSIPFEEGSFDIVFCFEVLQHTYVNEALKEIYRVLKPNGEVYIGERNHLSILGFLKPFYEILGKWMYLYDSPFKERWYSKNKWIKILHKEGFLCKNIFTVEGDGKRLVNRYFLIESSKNDR